MEIQIGNFNRLIKSFNVSSRKQDEDIVRTQLTIDCIDIDDDVEYISNSITEEMEENNGGEEILGDLIDTTIETVISFIVSQTMN